MRIQKVIHASDDNSFYLDFWKPVSMIWKLKFGVEPYLIHIGDRKDISQEYGTVVNLPRVDNVPIHTLCQIGRYWLPSTDLEAVWMTSDIDMLPISKDYFFNSIEQFSNDSFISLNSNLHESHPKIHYPCCYNIAKGSTFVEILGLEEGWLDFVRTFPYRDDNYTHNPEGSGLHLSHWSADEMWSSIKLNSFEDQSRIVRLSRDCGPSMCRRIDRVSWNWIDRLIEQEYYYDCHCNRPYEKYKLDIDHIVSKILKQ